MNERDLKDPTLTRAFRAAQANDHAPAEWTRDALALAHRAPVVAPSPAPVLPVILPHLAGVLVLLGVTVGVLTQPDIVIAAWRSAAASVSATTGGVPPVFLAAALLPPLVAMLALEASRGFRDLKRLTR